MIDFFFGTSQLTTTLVNPNIVHNNIIFLSDIKTSISMLSIQDSPRRQVCHKDTPKLDQYYDSEGIEVV